MTHVAQYYADKCDKIQTKYSIENITECVSNQPDESQKLSIDDEAEGEFESSMNVHPKMKNHCFKKETLSSRKIVKPSATMQGLMSACYEGLGLGVGSLIGGYMIDNFGILTIWRSAGFLSTALVLFNLIIEFLKFCRKV